MKSTFSWRYYNLWTYCLLFRRNKITITINYKKGKYTQQKVEKRKLMLSEEKEERIKIITAIFSDDVNLLNPHGVHFCIISTERKTRQFRF